MVSKQYKELLEFETCKESNWKNARITFGVVVMKAVLQPESGDKSEKGPNSMESRIPGYRIKWFLKMAFRLWKMDGKCPWLDNAANT